MSDWQQVTELSVKHVGQVIEVEVRTDSLRYGSKIPGVRVVGQLEQLVCHTYAGGEPDVVDIRISGILQALGVPAQNRFRVAV